MQHNFMVTFIGDDRPGLVDRLSSIIEAQGGNWNESRLSQLGGKFAGLILVSLATNDPQPLEDALRDLSATGVSVRVTPTADIAQSAAQATSGRRVSLNILGPDRPGIVKEIAHALAERDINVIEMHSNVSSAPMSAELLFAAQVEAVIPQDSNLDELGLSLEAIANTMTLEIDLTCAD